MSQFSSYAGKTLVQMKIHANQQNTEIASLRGVLDLEYARHENDAKLANFNQCGCDFCVRARAIQ